MALKSLHDLLIEELKDIYNAEKQLTRALPKMAKSASNDKLRQAFEEHLTVTENQITRLEKVFRELEMTARGKKCVGMEGIINEGKEKMEEDLDENVLDAALIASAQKVEHYEIASYGTLRTYAQQLGYEKIADMLQETLDEESNANELLTDIAESEINYEAIEGEEE
jgi:ferritin-like metal-binding protein YciE